MAANKWQLWRLLIQNLQNRLKETIPKGHGFPLPLDPISCLRHDSANLPDRWHSSRTSLGADTPSLPLYPSLAPLPSQARCVSWHITPKHLAFTHAYWLQQGLRDPGGELSAAGPSGGPSACAFWTAHSGFPSPAPPQQTTGWERRQRICVLEPSTHSKISPRPFPISWKLMSVSRTQIL